MERKADRVTCGTRMFWNGRREIIDGAPPKEVTFGENGVCECPISSKKGKDRKRQLKCKAYLNWVSNR